MITTKRDKSTYITYIGDLTRSKEVDAEWNERLGELRMFVRRFIDSYRWIKEGYTIVGDNGYEDRVEDPLLVCQNQFVGSWHQINDKAYSEVEKLFKSTIITTESGLWNTVKNRGIRGIKETLILDDKILKYPHIVSSYDPEVLVRFFYIRIEKMNTTELLDPTEMMVFKEENDSVGRAFSQYYGISHNDYHRIKNAAERDAHIPFPKC
jgi:hypothetical protein